MVKQVALINQDEYRNAENDTRQRGKIENGPPAPHAEQWTGNQWYRQRADIAASDMPGQRIPMPFASIAVSQIGTAHRMLGRTGDTRNRTPYHQRPETNNGSGKKGADAHQNITDAQHNLAQDVGTEQAKNNLQKAAYRVWNSDDKSNLCVTQMILDLNKRINQWHEYG